MQKKFRKMVFLPLFLAALFMMTACEEPQQTADLEIRLDETTDRTLAPKDPEEFRVTSYHVECQHVSGGTVHQVDSTRKSVVFNGLAIGRYNITATGKAASGQEIVRGSTTFDLSGDNTTAIVRLNELIGTGDINMTFSWKDDIVDSPSVEIELTPVDSQKVDPVKKTLQVSGSTAQFSQTGLPCGSYTLRARLYSGSTVVAGCLEALRIDKDATLTGTINFNLDELPSSAGQITIDDNAGTPVICRITGIEDGDTVDSRETVTAALEISSADSSIMTVSWYLDGEKIGTGESVSFTPPPGQHRLDVVVIPDKLGATGSTAISFEAALMGSTGVPVTGAVISENEVENLYLSSSMEMTFLEDGRLLLIDNSERKAQIISIKNNMLEVENFQTLESQISAVTAVGGLDKIVMADSDTSEAVVWTYNKGTAALKKEYGNNSVVADSDRTFIDVYGLSSTSALDECFTVFGRIMLLGDPSKTMNLSASHSAADKADLYPEGSNWFNQLDGTFSGTFDLFAASPSGIDAVLIDRDTGLTVFWAVDGSRTRVLIGEGMDYSDATAAVPLPASASQNIRFIVADGDKLRIFERERTNTTNRTPFSQAGSDIRRTAEGSGLDTVQLLLSNDEAFLYALNQGNDTISTFSVSSRGEIAFIEATQLDFTPQEACISPNGGYMIVRGTGGELAVMRIRLS